MLGTPRMMALAKEMMETNGGPIDAEDTTDGVDYVMVTRAVFDAFEREVKQYDAEQNYCAAKVGTRDREKIFEGRVSPRDKEKVFE